MLVTHKEAKIKDCCNPAWQFLTQKEDFGQTRQTCQGSVCMAWNCVYRRIRKDRLPTDPMDLRLRPECPTEEWEMVGWCGHAGNPPEVELLLRGIVQPFI